MPTEPTQSKVADVVAALHEVGFTVSPPVYSYGLAEQVDYDALWSKIKTIATQEGPS